MARNKFRKKHFHGKVFPAPLAGILLMAGMLALSYLWLRGRCDAMGVRIKDLERERLEIRRCVVNEEYKWANITSPQNMEQLLQTHNLVMKYPDEKDIVRVRRPATEVPAPHTFAQHTGTAVND